MNKIHTIHGGWLYVPLKHDYQNPRMKIVGNKLLVWAKDGYAEDTPQEYKFVGYCQDKYAFKIKCLGKKCTWSHNV